MTTRNRAPRARRRGPPKRYKWITMNDSLTSVSAGSQLGVELVNQSANDLSGATLTRIRAEIQIAGVTVGARVNYSQGFTMITDDAFAAAALPDPGSDDVRWSWFNMGIYAGLPGGDGVTLEVEKIQVDQRVAWKIPASQVDLIWVFDNEGAAALSTAIRGRALYQIR